MIRNNAIENEREVDVRPRRDVRQSSRFKDFIIYFK